MPKDKNLNANESPPSQETSNALEKPVSNSENKLSASELKKLWDEMPDEIIITSRREASPESVKRRQESARRNLGFWQGVLTAYTNAEKKDTETQKTEAPALEESSSLETDEPTKKSKPSV